MVTNYINNFTVKVVKYFGIAVIKNYLLLIKIKNKINNNLILINIFFSNKISQ